MEHYLKGKKLHTQITFHAKTRLKNKQENNRMIIKETDKGSTEVILNKTNHRTKIQEIRWEETNELIN